jgi:hypothetical protein
VKRCSLQDDGLVVRSLAESSGICEAAGKMCCLRLRLKTYNPVPLDLGVRQQLSLVPCAAAPGDRSSSSHLTCVDCRSLSGRTSCSGSCNASAVAAKAKDEADTYAGIFSPATSTQSSAAFGTFGRIGTSIATVVVGGWTSSSGSCNTGAVAVKAEDKANKYTGTSGPVTPTHSLSDFISSVGTFGRICTRVAV